MRRIVALLCSVPLAGAVLFPGAAAQADTGASPLPKDPAAHGYVGLCDEAGRNISGGSIDAAPFIWKAVASQAPPAQYSGAGQNTVLTLFQPRPGVDATEWSGAGLTAASFYADKALPAAQATYGDPSLKTVMATYPPRVDGLYVLRMTFGKANYGLYDSTYPTTTIQVVGTSWHVVSGGTVDCAAATAKSNEQLTGAVGTRDTTPRSPSSGSEHVIGHVRSDTRGAIPSGSSGASSVGVHPYTQASVRLGADGKPVSTSSSSALWLWLLVPAALLVAGGAILRRRRTIGRSTTG